MHQFYRSNPKFIASEENLYIFHAQIHEPTTRTMWSFADWQYGIEFTEGPRAANEFVSQLYILDGQRCRITDIWFNNTDHQYADIEFFLLDESDKPIRLDAISTLHLEPCKST